MGARIVAALLILLPSLASAGPDVEQKRAELDSKREAALKACLSTDINCEYGTANNCRPSVPYTDSWGVRFTFALALVNAQKCEADWSKVCGPQVSKTITRPMVQDAWKRLDDLFKRSGAMPPELACPLPADWADGSGAVLTARDWCWNRKADCLDVLPRAIHVMEEAVQVESCLYTNEYKLKRDRLKADHDADCQAKYAAQKAADDQQLAKLGDSASATSSNKPGATAAKPTAPGGGQQQPGPGAATSAGAPKKSDQQVAAEQKLAHANATVAQAQAVTQAWTAAAPQLEQVAAQAPDIEGRIRGSFEATFPIGGFIASPDGVSLAFPFRLQVRLFKWFTSKESFERDERQKGIEVTGALGMAPAISGGGASYVTLGARYWHGWFGIGPQLATGGGDGGGYQTLALQLSAGAYVAHRRGQIIVTLAGDTKATEQYDGFVSASFEVALRLFGFSFRADKFEGVGIIAFGMKVVLPW
jgi:hypothetical protein